MNSKNIRLEKETTSMKHLIPTHNKKITINKYANTNTKTLIITTKKIALTMTKAITQIAMLLGGFILFTVIWKLYNAHINSRIPVTVTTDINWLLGGYIGLIIATIWIALSTTYILKKSRLMKN